MITGIITQGKTVAQYRCQRCGDIVTVDRMPVVLKCEKCKEDNRAVFAGRPIYCFKKQ